MEILSSLVGHPVYEAITMGHPERMGLREGWSVEHFLEQARTVTPGGRPYQNLCIGCDRFRALSGIGHCDRRARKGPACCINDPPPDGLRSRATWTFGIKSVRLKGPCWIVGRRMSTDLGGSCLRSVRIAGPTGPNEHLVDGWHKPPGSPGWRRLRVPGGRSPGPRMTASTGCATGSTSAGRIRCSGPHCAVR